MIPAPERKAGSFPRGEGRVIVWLKELRVIKNEFGI
jgi:hypothetical protein